MTSHSVLANELSFAAHKPAPSGGHAVTKRRLDREELNMLCHALSHDLRAPLRSIEGFSQVVLESICEKLDHQTAAYFERVIKASQEMGSLLDGLLQLTRVTRHVMRKALVDISDMARRVVAHISNLHPDRKVKVTITPELSAFGDPLLLKLALEQLFDNAWKFTQSQSSPEIFLGASYDEKETVFHLFDNGIGFDMAQYERLFGVFERLHTLPNVPGSGIGLAIVERIIQRHEGAIWANGIPGLGACFWFRLPNHATHETTTLHFHDRRQPKRRDARQTCAGQTAGQV